MRKVVTAGQAIVDGLVRNGVRHIFGIPGVHTYSLIDALTERQGELAYLGTRHEQGAAYMAYGYACSSGRVGAYTCVPGPGVLNTSAALSTAYAANAPVLCLTSEVFSHEIGRGHGILHELPDQLAILRGLTKWSARISHPSEAPRLVARAFEELTSGRRRPVALECPWDTLGQKAQVELDVSARPMAPPLPAPVTAHRSGRGIVSEDSPFGLDLAAAYALWAKTDVLLAIGTRMELQFIRWKQVPSELRIVRIDIDPTEMPRRPTEVGVVTDARLGVRALLEALAPRLRKRASREVEFQDLKARARREFEVVQPQLAFLDAIRAVLPRDGFFVEEISQEIGRAHV